jgi:hypothetical protein
MTIQKQLSHLSFAAIVLVFAALPALAQTASVDNQNAVATTSTLAKADQMAALRKALSSTPGTKESTIVVAPTATEKQPSFSLNQFMKSASEPAVISDSKVLEFTSLETPTKTFNDSSSKTINFVPSRGPKLPWQ